MIHVKFEPNLTILLWLPKPLNVQILTISVFFMQTYFYFLNSSNMTFSHITVSISMISIGIKAPYHKWRNKKVLAVKENKTATMMTRKDCSVESQMKQYSLESKKVVQIERNFQISFPMKQQTQIFLKNAYYVENMSATN